MLSTSLHIITYNTWIGKQCIATVCIQIYKPQQPYYSIKSKNLQSFRAFNPIPQKMCIPLQSYSNAYTDTQIHPLWMSIYWWFRFGRFIFKCYFIMYVCHEKWYSLIDECRCSLYSVTPKRIYFLLGRYYISLSLSLLRAYLPL